MPIGLLFFSIIASLVILAVYSQLNNGVIDTYGNMAYAWGYGPTASKAVPVNLILEFIVFIKASPQPVFTLLAAFWARIELQAFRYTPRFAMRQPDVSKD